MALKARNVLIHPMNNDYIIQLHKSRLK